MFLNYTWTCGLPDKDGNSTPDLLANSISALENDSRRTDIFVGVDVFGRGRLGGGGFQCDQAVKEIIHRGLSLAIFAPGWTYEIPHRKTLTFTFDQQFKLRLGIETYFHTLLRNDMKEKKTKKTMQCSMQSKCIFTMFPTCIYHISQTHLYPVT